ncbi:Calcium/proton exchanger [Stereum hirsutum FP-91666 SS1]|uniref:Calcium/proton exchanger n=1 Tax=Stereum hirsutum (strain FP-91666) TaxID=721885 RepID=UPI000440C38F|nr:Calcium/proton exchanger [Stereum hirsutum FP-91666 SS1]EIM89813.1 Calcium/proton exchanger [Stereum hirsutum FP-91666 SS1]
MSPSERDPLLTHNGNGHPATRLSFFQRVVKLVKAEGEPGWLASFKFFFFGSWFNVLLILTPLAVVAHVLDWDAALRFSFSFLAIMPLAKLLGEATEQMSMKLGQTLAGLLNATFGNAVEIIVGISALLQDQIQIVQTSLLGSILSNILLVLGCSFFAGGLYHSENVFQVTAAQTSASLMTLACITLIIPAAYHSARVDTNPDDEYSVIPSTNSTSDMVSPMQQVHDLDKVGQKGLLTISRGTALLLLATYVAYLVFQLKTHHRLFQPQVKKAPAAPTDEENGTLSPAGVQAQAEDEAEEEEEIPKMSVVAAGVALLSVTIITSFVADILVASIEETADRYSIPKPFIGLILLPIVANAAEHVTSVWMAMKNKMELTIGVCVGSSIQLATFVVPLLVIVGWISGHELTLFFANFETVVFFVSVLLVNLLIQDGRSNYMEGLMLIVLYLIIAIAFWVSG